MSDLYDPTCERKADADPARLASSLEAWMDDEEYGKYLYAHELRTVVRALKVLAALTTSNVTVHHAPPEPKIGLMTTQRDDGAGLVGELGARANAGVKDG